MNIKQIYLDAVFPSEKPKKKRKPYHVSNAAGQPTLQVIIVCAVFVVMQLMAANNIVFPSPFITALGSTLIYAIVAIGFCLLLGYSGLASLGTAGFIGLGAYMAYYIVEGLGAPYILALLATLAVSILIGVSVGFISLRIEGIYLSIMTLGLSEIIRNLLMAIKPTIKIDRNSIRLFGVNVNDKAVFILIVVTFAVLMILTGNLIRSPYGRGMLAMKNSTSAAQAMGINLMKYRLLAFVITTIFASIGGLLYMMYIRNVTTSTSTLLTLTTSLNILGAVIIGGSKSLWGTTVGAFIIYGLQSMFLSKIEFFQKYPAFITMVTGLLIILVVMFYPGGIAQIVSNLQSRFRHKRYDRRLRDYE